MIAIFELKRNPPHTWLSLCKNCVTEEKEKAIFIEEPHGKLLEDYNCNIVYSYILKINDLKETEIFSQMTKLKVI